METRKVALIIFLIGLIFLSLGAIVYVARQKSADKNLQTAKLAAPPPASETNQVAKTADSGIVTETGKPITEEQIQATIEAKKTQISQESKGRAYTSEELFFITAPRQAAISELKKGR